MQEHIYISVYMETHDIAKIHFQRERKERIVRDTESAAIIRQQKQHQGSETKMPEMYTFHVATTNNNNNSSNIHKS